MSIRASVSPAGARLVVAVRFGFRLLYNDWRSPTSGGVVASLGEWWRWQRTALNHLTAPPGATVMEWRTEPATFSAPARAAYRPSR